MKCESGWISVKEEKPPCDGNRDLNYCLAFHTEHGTGVAWFHDLGEDDDGVCSDMEEDLKDKYICSCQFIKNRLDGNYLIDEEHDIDIFENSPHFGEGTVTHWMPLPEGPKNV